MARRAARPHAPRPFGVADALVLVGAFAAGLAVVRFTKSTFPWGGWLREVFFPSGGDTSWLGRMQRARQLAQAWFPCYGVATVAVLGLRLRRPRPSWPRLCRQPGFAAGLAASLALAFWMAEAVAHVGYDPPWTRLGWASFVETYLDEMPTSAGYAVAGAWVLLVSSRRWRAEGGWLDRSGRILGAGWLVSLAVEVAFRVF